MRVRWDLRLHVAVPGPAVLIGNAAPTFVWQGKRRDYSQFLERIDLHRPDGAQVQPTVAEVELVDELLAQRQPAQPGALVVEDLIRLGPTLVIRQADASTVLHPEFVEVR